MGLTPHYLRLLLAKGREILILRPRSDEPLPWQLPGTDLLPNETLEAAGGRCGQELSGILVQVQAVLPPIRLHQAGLPGQLSLVLARYVEQRNPFPSGLETRWILDAHWIEYHFEPPSATVLEHYQASRDLG